MRRAPDPNHGSLSEDGSARRQRSTTRIRLAVADEHPIVLEGLDRLFRTQPDVRIVARCRTVAEALAAAHRHRPHVLILEPHLPGASGLAILHALRRDHPRTSVVLFTASLSDDEAIESLRLGVRGMVLKEQPPEQLVRCVRKVHEGGEWIEKIAIGSALRTLLRREAGTREVAGVLTPREIELVRMVAHGLANATIAQRLLISPGTVKVHLHHVYRKLKLAGRIELMRYAREKQIL